MSFLAPLFFLGLAAIVVPVLVHLIQRERKHVVHFPSLMFVRRIPYQSVRRRRIRHWFLLLMRAAAIALIVAAFARPFFRQSAAAAAAALGGDRELVILLDQSASMGFGDHWDRARRAAGDAIASIGAGDRATLVLFGRNAEENMRATSDRGRLDAALALAKVTSGATRYGPALKLADSILARSTLPRREAMLISDFQRSGWSGAEDVRFGEGVKLTPVSVASPSTGNISVPSVSFGRASFSGQERITVTAGVTNTGASPVNQLPVALEIDGRSMESKPATIAPGASASVVFQQFTLAEPAVRGAIKAGSDDFAADNAFHFVLTPSQPVSVLVVENGDRAESSFYLGRALGIGNTPAFQVEIVPAARVSASTLEGKSVVILNDTMVPPGTAGGVLKRYVERGGGLLVALGGRTSWPTSEADVLPGKVGGAVDPNDGRGTTVTLDYAHQAFEIFKAPRSGDFSSARVHRYRALQTGPEDRVLARYDDGAVAAAEKRIGTGRVIAWTTTLDNSWNDVPIRPVYLPLVQQLVKYLARYEQPSSWLTVGQVVDLSALLKTRADRTVMTPSGDRIRVPASEPGILELNEQGIYEIRTGSSATARPDRIAVNLDPAESDLTPLDPDELVASVTGHAVQTTAQAQAPVEMTAEEAEKRQGIWWYLLVGGLLLLAAEMAVSNVLSRNERFL
jgi:hypothetical protein